METKKPHYVPARFLQSWCGQDNRPWCRYLDGVLFQPSLAKIGLERKLYAYQPVSADDFSAMIVLTNLAENKPIRSFLIQILRNIAYAMAFDSIKKFGALDAVAKTIWVVGHEATILNAMDDNTIARIIISRSITPTLSAFVCQELNKYLVEGQEPFMCEAEEHFWSVLDKLLAGINPKELTEVELKRFLVYFVIQMGRAPRMCSLWFDNSPSWGLGYFSMMRFIASKCAILESLLDKFRLDIVNNNTSIPFITGDFPLRNIAKDGAKSGHLDLFFPISPNKAIFFAENGRLNQVYPWLLHPDSCNIHHLNQMICEVCVRFVIASSSDVISTYDYKASGLDSLKNT